MTHAPLDLAGLLAPVSLAEFFATYHEKAPLVLQRGAPGFYGPVLTRADVDHLLTGTGLRAPAIRLVKDGQTLPVEEYTRDLPWGGAVFSGMIDADRVATHFRDGCTVVLEALHRQWPPLGYLCRSLEEHFGHPLQTNVYFTPRRSQGFVAHWDTHDVFVLQLAGTKHWKLYEGPIHLPGRRQPFVKGEAQPGRLLRELEVQPGDLLYIPRGVMHEAATSDTDSLHITIGLLPYTWYDVFRAALDAIEGDAAFRESLPPLATRDPAAAAAALGDAFRERAAALGSATDLAAILDGLATQFVQGRFPLVPGVIDAAWEAEAVQPTDRVRRRPGVLARTATRGDEVVLLFHNKEVAFPDWVAPVLAVLLPGEPVVVADLPELDEAGQLVLVRRLLAEGFLERLPGDGAPA